MGRGAGVLVAIVLTGCASSTGAPTTSTVAASVAATATAASTVASAPTSTTLVPSTTAVPLDAVGRWTEDLAALDAGIRRIHPNPFWRQSEAMFEAALAAAPPRLAEMSDADARAEIMRLMAQVDGHSGVYLDEAGFHLYDLHLYEFDDGVAVVAAPDEALVGATVLAIGDDPIAAALDAVRPWSPFDNEWTVRTLVPTLLVTPEVLHAAGVVDDVDRPGYVLQLRDGTTRTVDPVAQTWKEYTAHDPTPIGMARRPSSSTLARIDEAFWLDPDLRPTANGGRALYLQYNRAEDRSGELTIATFAGQLTERLAAGDVTRLVVDLRFNPGGDNLTYGPLLRALVDSPVLRAPGALVVLIGRQTFSAATLFAAELEQRTSAVFVGEPTGGRPNLYANPRPLKLPHSGIVVEVSSKLFRTGDTPDDRDAITPDEPASMTLADFLADRDPVLDAALALP